MTREEAIRILDPETTKEELAGIKGYAAMMKVVDEACILAVAALREQEERRWIPVTKRLPGIGAVVLAYSKIAGIYVDYYEGEAFDYFDVTHWMPLPQPPKGE